MTDLEQLSGSEMNDVRDAALALEASAYELSDIYAETEPLQ
jgi:hypothetical protein